MSLAEQLYLQFTPIFKDQLGLELSDAVVLNDEKDAYILKVEKLGVSMASLSLQLSDDEHLAMANFLEILGAV